MLQCCQNPSTMAPTELIHGNAIRTGIVKINPCCWICHHLTNVNLMVWVSRLEGITLRHYLFRIILLIPMLALITACSSSNSWQPSDAALAGDPDAMWEDGQVAVQAGEELVSRGESRLADGRSEVREGEALINGGNTVVLQSRQDYQNAARVSGVAVTPAQVEDEAQRLRTIGRRWEDGIADIRRGNRLVDSGNENINQGQSEIQEGRVLIESGSTLMRNSQRIRLGDELLPSPAGLNEPISRQPF